MRSTSVLFLIGALLLGCGGVKNPLQPAVQPVQNVAVLCDAESGSSACTPTSLGATLDVLVRELGPASRIVVYPLASPVSNARPVGSFTVTAPRKKSVRARAVHMRRSQEAARAALLTPALFATTGRRSSPIAETIGMIIATRDRSRPLQVVALTDAREVSRAGGERFNFETRLPSPDIFGGILRDVLGHQRDVTVHFSCVRIEPGTSVTQYNGIRSLWTDALRARGIHVTWSSDVITTLGASS